MTLAAWGSDKKTPDSKVHGANMGPRVGPMLAPWTLLSGTLAWTAFLFQKECFDGICYSQIDNVVCLVAAPLCGIWFSLATEMTRLSSWRWPDDISGLSHSSDRSAVLTGRIATGKMTVENSTDISFRLANIGKTLCIPCWISISLRTI